MGQTWQCRRPIRWTSDSMCSTSCPLRPGRAPQGTVTWWDDGTSMRNWSHFLKYTKPSETDMEAGNLYVFFPFSIEQPCKYAGIFRPLTVGVELPWECYRVNSPSDTLQSLQIDLDHPGAQAFLQCSQQRLKETRPELMVQLPAASSWLGSKWRCTWRARMSPSDDISVWGTNAGKTM